jgi:hypothetical protein
VVFRKHLDSLLTLVVDVQPTRRLRDEPREEDNQTGEEHLQVHWDGPADVALKGDCTSDGARSQDRAGEPEGVTVSSNDAAVGWVSSLDDVDGTGSGNDGHAETEDEATGLELPKVGIERRSSVDDGANDDDPRADLHTNLSSPSINGWADEEEGADTTNLVHSGVESSPWTIVGAVEEVKECLVGGETTKDRAIKAVLWSLVSQEIKCR